MQGSLTDPLAAPQEQAAQSRQKSVAALQPIDPHAVLARLSGPMTETSAAFISDIHGHFAVPAGEKAPGVESAEYRNRLKHRAADISRSQCEVYSFSTMHNLSKAATDELLEMLSNVSSFLVPIPVQPPGKTNEN